MEEKCFNAQIPLKQNMLLLFHYAIAYILKKLQTILYTFSFIFKLVTHDILAISSKLHSVIF